MARPYPQALRDRVLAACDDGMTTALVAKTFRVSPSWVRRIKQRRREHGQIAPKPMGGVTLVKIDLDQLRELVRTEPDATLVELRDRLGCGCCESAVCMALQRLGLSLKKKHSTPPSKTGLMWQRPVFNGSKTSPPWMPVD